MITRFYCVILLCLSTFSSMELELHAEAIEGEEVVSVIFPAEEPETYSNGKWNFTFETLALDPERVERIRKAAEPILSGEITAFKAFQEGCEKPLAAYLKVGNEDRLIRRIEEGKEVVNEETKTAAFLLKQLLSDIDSVTFIKIGSDYFAVTEHANYDLKKLLEVANFNQITFSKAMLAVYHDLIDYSILKEQPKLPFVWGRPTNKDFIKNDPEAISHHLSLAEKEAINIYTGKAYLQINAFLRGDLDAVVANHQSAGEINEKLREALLHAAVAVSGLNKIPDFVPPKNPDGTTPKYLFRGESTIPESLFAKRKWAVEQGGEVTLECGFISTSYGKPNEYFFNENSKSAIMFKNAKGKKVTQLSQYGGAAREILLPPTHIQWRYHKDIITDKEKKVIALFLAKPVSAPFGTIPRGGPLSDEKIVIVE